MAKKCNLLCPPLSFRVVAVDTGAIEHDRWRERVERGFDAVAADAEKVVFLVRPEDSMRKAKQFACFHGVQHKSVFAPVKSYERSEVTRAIYLAGGLVDEWPTELHRKVSLGKLILHLGIRKTNLVERFSKYHGMVCYPFFKIALVSHCPYDCSFCFGQQTHRIAPFTQVFLNLEDYWQELQKLSQRAVAEGVIYRLNAGELGEPMALEPLFGTIAEIVAVVERLPNLELLILTKSANLGCLPEMSSGRIVIACSLTTARNQQRHEFKTATVPERIRSMKQGVELGAKAQARYDPLITYDGEGRLADTRRTTELLFEQVPDLQGITMGQPRFYPGVLGIIRRRHPECLCDFAGAQYRSAEGRFREAEEARYRVYEAVRSVIWDVVGNASFPVNVCKESGQMNRRLGICHPKGCICNAKPRSEVAR